MSLSEAAICADLVSTKFQNTITIPHTIIYVHVHVLTYEIPLLYLSLSLSLQGGSSKYSNENFED